MLHDFYSFKCVKLYFMAQSVVSLGEYSIWAWESVFCCCWTKQSIDVHYILLTDDWCCIQLCPCLVFCLLDLSSFFFFFRAATAAYGSSQARSWIGATAAGLHYLHDTDHGNTRSLTHWARPGIKLTSLWILVRFVTTKPQWELQIYPFSVYGCLSL